MNTSDLVENLPSSDEVRERAQQAGREAAPWVVLLGRLGYAGHGALYVVIGLLAIQAAAGLGGAATDTEGVLTWIAETPLGPPLLSLAAVALAGYAAWRLVQAIRNTDGYPPDARGYAARLGQAISGVAHAGLALSAAGMAIGARPAENHDVAREWATRLLGLPLGHILLMSAGLVIIGVGIFQFRIAYQADFQKDLSLDGANDSGRRWLVLLGRFGFATRGMVFFILGIFLVMAGTSGDSGQARGPGAVLELLAAQPAGHLLLGIVALGLMAYGVFLVSQARFRRMEC